MLQQLSNLNHTINDRAEFLQSKNQLKIKHKAKKIGNNYQAYIREHRERIIMYAKANQLCKLLQTVFRKNKLHGFWKMGNHSANSGTNMHGMHIYNTIISDPKIEYERNIKQKQIKMKINVLVCCTWNIMKVGLRASFMKLRQNKKCTQDNMNNDGQVKLINIQNNSQNLQKIRIMEIKSQTSNETDDRLIRQITHTDDNSISCNLLDVSIYENKVESQNQLNDLNSIKTPLVHKIAQCDAQISRMISKHKIEKQLILKQIQSKILTHSLDTHNQEPDQGYSIYERQSISLSDLQNLDINEQQPDINQLIQTNSALEQEADHIRLTIECLLQMSKHQRQLNPQIINLLNQAKQILKPNPLGFSFIIN